MCHIEASQQSDKTEKNRKADADRAVAVARMGSLAGGVRAVR